MQRRTFALRVRLRSVAWQGIILVRDERMKNPSDTSACRIGTMPAYTGVHAACVCVCLCRALAMSSDRAHWTTADHLVRHSQHTIIIFTGAATQFKSIERWKNLRGSTYRHRDDLNENRWYFFFFSSHSVLSCCWFLCFLLYCIVLCLVHRVVLRCGCCSMVRQ